jgi:hypothetical protein
VPKNTINKPTNVSNAHWVNSQETDKVDNKTLDAEFSNKPVTQEDKFNLINHNAIDAKHALVDKDLLVMFAKLQDQFAIASKNTIN